VLDSTEFGDWSNKSFSSSSSSSFSSSNCLLEGALEEVKRLGLKLAQVEKELRFFFVWVYTFIKY
jgi:hypothetical protein